MRLQRLTPRRRTPIFQPIPSADNRPQIRRDALLLGDQSRFEESIGDDGAACGSEAVVVEFEDLEGAVAGEEGDHRVNGTTAIGVVAQVDLDETCLVDERITEGGQGLRDFGDQTTGEDVRKVGNLEQCGVQSTDALFHVTLQLNTTYLEHLRLFQIVCDSFRSFDTNGISSEMDLLKGSGIRGQIRLYVSPGIEFQSLSVKRQGICVGSHRNNSSRKIDERKEKEIQRIQRGISR